MVRARCLPLVLALVCVGVPAQAGTFYVRDVLFTFQNLEVVHPGDRVAPTVTSSNYAIGPSGGGLFARPIVPFRRADFAPIADGRPILGARLHYRSPEDFAEPGEIYGSEARLFTTAKTDFTLDDRWVLASLTGDGGPYTVIGLFLLAHGDRQPHVLEFSPEAVDTLDAAIHGTDPTIGISMREFAGNDILDEFAFGVAPGVMTLEVDAPAVTPPVCDVATSALAYGDGDAVVLSHLRYANPDVVAIPVRLRLELVVPTVGTVRLLDATSPALTGHFDRDLGPVRLFSITPQMPRGTWTARCAVEDLATGDLLADDSASFTVQ